MSSPPKETSFLRQSPAEGNPPAVLLRFLQKLLRDVKTSPVVEPVMSLTCNRQHRGRRSERFAHHATTIWGFASAGFPRATPCVISRPPKGTSFLRQSPAEGFPPAVLSRFLKQLLMGVPPRNALRCQSSPDDDLRLRLCTALFRFASRYEGYISIWTVNNWLIGFKTISQQQTRINEQFYVTL